MKIIKKTLRLAAFTLFTLVVLVILGFNSLARQVDLPKPEGKYNVGVTHRIITTNRVADFHQFVDSNRTVYLKIWYPAIEVTNKEKASSIEGGKQSVKEVIKNPSLLERVGLKQILKIKTNAYFNIPIATGKFPMITYSHQYGGWASENADLFESLASKGFIIVAITHLNQAVFAPINEKTIIDSKTIPLFDTLDKPLIKTLYGSIDNAEQQSVLDSSLLAIRKHPYLESRNRYSDIWSDDIITAIDYMKEAQIKRRDFFFEKIDTSKIGSMGFSFGGNAAINATLKDSSIRAAINMDGTVYGDFYDKKSDANILFLARSNPKKKTLSYFGNFRDKNNQHYPTLMFRGAEHSNFCDMNYFSALFRWVGVTGSIDSQFMSQHKNQIVYDFFITSFYQSDFNPEKYTQDERIINYKHLN
ncbi:hypothetical protein WAF17_18700 [Bernardetia sp. ABR2-2B]|uniref:alpha/beta hydrolase n=1 Tax=Bernardetia sp. ABR2-2B TaxID=3127472 RepID=UPI0030CCDC02